MPCGILGQISQFVHTAISQFNRMPENFTDFLINTFQYCIEIFVKNIFKFEYGPLSLHNIYSKKRLD
jgi:hypothetical protein